MASAFKRHFSGSNSSLQQSDEDDDDDLDENEANHADNAVGGSGSGGGDLNKSREEKRRISHTNAEQKRRNAIKRGYDELQSVVPSCDFMDPSSSQKVCKATVLKRSIDYIHELEKEKDKQDQDLDSAKKEIIALEIMKANYEQLLQYHRNTPQNLAAEANDDVKFQLFVRFSDNLFNSFHTLLNTNSFGDLSGSMLNWIEQMCSANNLRNLIMLSLLQIANHILH